MKYDVVSIEHKLDNANKFKVFVKKYMLINRIYIIVIIKKKQNDKPIAQQIVYKLCFKSQLISLTGLIQLL